MTASPSLDYRLHVLGHLPLASLARAALYNRTYTEWQRAYQAAMRFAPVPPNITYINVTNSTNVTLLYTRDGIEVRSAPMPPLPPCARVACIASQAVSSSICRVR